MCGDFQNFNTLIMDKYPELVEYWLEIYHVMIRQEQRIDDLKTDNLKLQGLNDTLINIVKTYNLVGLNQHGRKEKNTETGHTGRQDGKEYAGGKTGEEETDSEEEPGS